MIQGAIESTGHAFSVIERPRCACQSDAARRRFIEIERTPFMYSDWVRAVFIHYEVSPDIYFGPAAFTSSGTCASNRRKFSLNISASFAAVAS